MEINIKIGKKELIIFLVVALIATGIGLGTWLGIKSYREWEPDPIYVEVIDSEDLGDSRRIDFIISVYTESSALIEVKCNPHAVFNSTPTLPFNVSRHPFSFFLEGNFEMRVRYTFEFHFETLHGNLIVVTLKHKF